MKFLSYGHQDITEEDIRAVTSVLKSDYLTQGPAVTQFESAIVKETKSKFATVCVNGTAALHLTMLAANIRRGDTVLTSSISFVASANCAKFVGAEVVFADIDSKTACISPKFCKRLLEEAVSDGNPIKAVVTVDLAGHPCDMEAFAQLKAEYGFTWIQDSCHSLGASWADKEGRVWQIGESEKPDMTVFSFHPVKNITTGEGGAIVTHSEILDANLKQFRTHGITKNSALFLNKKDSISSEGEINPWYYEMQSLGYNYRMTDIQAALGTSQIKRLKKYILRRNEIIDIYKQKLCKLNNISFIQADKNIYHAYHLAVLKIDFVAVGKTRAKVMNELKLKGIGTQVHYTPIPMMPFYVQNNNCNLSDFPNALDYYNTALSIPCFPTMTDEDVNRVCKAIIEVIQ